MSSNSNPKVTITLGRSGQVVTKEGKRLPEEGSWSYGDSSSLSSIKRHRGGGNGMKWRPGLSGEKGSRIASNDLRLKLIRKRQLKRSQDAEKYPQKMAVHPASSRSSEAPASYRTLPSRPSSSGRYSSFRPPTYPEEYASGNGMAYSSQFVMEGSRRASSPGRISRPTRELSPQRMATLRMVDFSSSGSLVRNAGAQHAPPSRSWLAGSSPLRTVKPAPPQTSGAAGPRVAQTFGTTQQISQKLDEHVTVAGFLHSLGLGKYCINFQAEEVDMTVLKQMADKDLKDMGIPMGPRKKILLALLPPPKKRAS